MDVDALLETFRVVNVEAGMLVELAMMMNAYIRVRKKSEGIY